jgi:deoxyribonuclease V
MKKSFYEEAVAAQQELVQQVSLEDSVISPRLVGGMDVSYHRYDPTRTLYAAAIVLDYQTLSVVEQATAMDVSKFPYIPGLLGFREVPVLVKAFEKLHHRPDILLVDGHGISHPRRCGVASHLGVVLDIPTIGVAKSILVGEPAAPLGLEVGSRAPLIWQKEILGMLYRSKKRAHPLIISVGHKVSLTTAMKIVGDCLRGYRLPEPTRRAHLAANACRRYEVGQ